MGRTIMSAVVSMDGSIACSPHRWPHLRHDPLREQRASVAGL